MALHDDLLLEPHPSDAKFRNPNERAFIAAVRAWAGNAAFVDVLLDLAHVARQWESEGGETYRAGSSCCIHLSRSRRRSSETHTDEVRDRRHRPRVVGA